MEILVFWIGTIVASFGMEVAQSYKMIKDIADAGYKFNLKNFMNFRNTNSNLKKFALLTMFIPIVNISQVFIASIRYNTKKSLFINQLIVNDCIEEMSEIEKTEYAKKPTGFNALMVPVDLEMRLKNAKSVRVNEYSEIFYETDKSSDDINILKVTGSSSILTPEEQKEKVLEILRKEQDNKQLNASKDDNQNNETPAISQESSVDKQIQTLEGLRNKLLEKQKELQLANSSEEQPTEPDKTIKLSGKRK